MKKYIWKITSGVLLLVCLVLAYSVYDAERRVDLFFERYDEVREELNSENHYKEKYENLKSENKNSLVIDALIQQEDNEFYYEAAQNNFLQYRVTTDKNFDSIKNAYDFSINKLLVIKECIDDKEPENLYEELNKFQNFYIKAADLNGETVFEVYYIKETDTFGVSVGSEYMEVASAAIKQLYEDTITK